MSPKFVRFKRQHFTISSILKLICRDLYRIINNTITVMNSSVPDKTRYDIRRDRLRKYVPVTKQMRFTYCRQCRHRKFKRNAPPCDSERYLKYEERSMSRTVNDASERDGISNVFLRDAAWPPRATFLLSPRFPRNVVEINFKRVARHIQITGARMRNRFGRARARYPRARLAFPN